MTIGYAGRARAPSSIELAIGIAKKSLLSSLYCIITRWKLEHEIDRMLIRKNTRVESAKSDKYMNVCMYMCVCEKKREKEREVSQFIASDKNFYKNSRCIITVFILVT